VGEPVQRRSGEPFAAQDLGPALERQVRRHDHAVAFVGRRDDIEEELGSGLARGDIPEFVEDEEVELGQLLTHAQQMPLLLGLE
jgi:hypothetical protein